MKIVKDILFFDQVSFDCVTIPDCTQYTYQANMIFKQLHCKINDQIDNDGNHFGNVLSIVGFVKSISFALARFLFFVDPDLQFMVF